jgi:hypothetical protein
MRRTEGHWQRRLVGTRKLNSAMDDVRLQVERAKTQAELAALELRVYDLIKDLAREGRAPNAEFFAEAGFAALGPWDHIGWAYQRMRLAVPGYESNLAEFAGLMRSKTETYWTIQPGAPLDRLVRWLSPRKLLTLRVARGGKRSTDLSPPSYSDEQFASRAEEGDKHAKSVAAMLSREGVTCDITEYRFRESEAEIAMFSQRETDLVLPRCGLGIEVKSRTCDWTSPAFTSKHKTLFVDTLSGYLLKVRIPLAYVVVSQESPDPVSVIPTFTCASWGCVRKRDHSRRKKNGEDFTDQFLEVPLKYLRNLRWLVDVCSRLETSETGDWFDVLTDAGYPSDLAAAVLRGTERAPPLPLESAERTGVDESGEAPFAS